jgi:hypothetical protein
MRIAFERVVFRQQLRTCIRVLLSTLFILSIEMEGSQAMSSAKGSDYLILENNRPGLTDFSARPSIGNLWILGGTVSDENPSGCTIVFGGVLDGHSVTVGADGKFTYSVELPSGTNGAVWATAFDDGNLKSVTQYSYIF